MQWKYMLYGVAFMHTTVQERRKFGPLGWNIPYEFNASDYNASVQFVQNHLDDMDPKKGPNWNCVRYMLGEVQYGGRVTDDYDQVLLNTYCHEWFGDSMFSNDFVFYKNSSCCYNIPKNSEAKTPQSILDFINQLPNADTPEVFGLHSNADIQYSTNNVNQILSTIVNIQPKESSGGGGETREDVVKKMALEFLGKLPADFLDHEVKARLKKMGQYQPINIFLRQEIQRMQRVISVVRSTLKDLCLAIEGTIVMSEALQNALDQMYDARIPASWSKVSWDSATIGFWFTELVERHAQFHAWIFGGRPSQFWLTGFFNPQGFLTAMRQEVTRANKGWSLDTVVLNNDVTKMYKEDVTDGPSVGVYIYGLSLDGAGWDKKNIRLIDPTPKILYTLLPVVHVFAINGKVNTDPIKDKKGSKVTYIYSCPVYKKPRRTALTYIFPILLKSGERSESWTLRGVAALCDTK